jgi:flagellar biosynthesis GTPase FlhF
MEDTEIAKGLLSTILKTDIVELSLKPQETTTTAFAGTQIVTVLRLDFVAVIKQANGTNKKVLIELQKTKRGTNIARFRRYLGEQYQKEDSVYVAGEEKTEHLEIVTIYFLGFLLNNTNVPVVKVENNYIDADTNQQLAEKPDDDFLLLLNHESYTIQIPLLKGKVQSRLLKVLKVFSQEYKTDNKHNLNFTEEETDPLIKQMLDRLRRAAADEELRRKMDVEDEYEDTYNKEFKALNDKYLQEKQRAEEEKQRAEEEKQRAEQATQQAEEEKQRAEEEKQRAEQATQQAEEEKQRAEEEKQRAEQLLQELNDLKKRFNL